MSIGPAAARAAANALRATAFSSVTSKTAVAPRCPPQPIGDRGERRRLAPRKAHPRAGGGKRERDRGADAAGPAPVTSAWDPASDMAGQRPVRAGGGPGEIGLVLQLAREILLRPGNRFQPMRAASCSVQAGSARCGRARAQRSARPAAMMELA